MIKGDIHIPNLDKLAVEKFGLILSIEKTLYSTRGENIHFLGYYSDDGWPVRSQYDLIASFCQPERTVTDPMITVSRALGEMYATMNQYEALIWYKIVLWLLEVLQVRVAEMEEFVQRNRRMFEF